MEIKIKKMRDNAIIPTRGSEKAAGIDLYACIDEPIYLHPNKAIIISSGIACEFPKGYFGILAVRSSIGIKKNIGLMNQIGIIDEDYRSDIKIALQNYGNVTQIIEPNERIAQLILAKTIDMKVKEYNELSETKRGIGGIGSTGRF